jgi:hypothetical protein
LTWEKGYFSKARNISTSDNQRSSLAVRHWTFQSNLWYRYNQKEGEVDGREGGRKRKRVKE